MARNPIERFAEAAVRAFESMAIESPEDSGPLDSADEKCTET